MEKEKSPFDEIFKRDTKNKEEKKEEEENGILNIEREEKTTILEESDEELELEENATELSKEDRYQNLVMDLLKHNYYGEAISVIEEMKEEFAS